MNGDCTPSPMKSCCQYSSSAALHPMGCSSFFPHSSPAASSSSTPSNNSEHSLPSAPIANGYGQSYGILPPTSSSVYPVPDYHNQYSSPLGFSSNPSFSSMALWK